MRHLIKSLCVLLALTSPALAADLPATVELALRKAGVPLASVAVVAVSYTHLTLPTTERV